MDAKGRFEKTVSPFGQLLDSVKKKCEIAGIWNAEMQSDLPKKWEKHGNMVILPANCFTQPNWRNLGPSLWRLVCDCLQFERVARKRMIDEDEYRSPLIDLLYGKDGWVEHCHDGIRYQYDVTRNIFSIGNVSEKLRVSKMDCKGEVLVDLFAGIGYLTLPLVLHTNAAHVHAIDWNTDAIEALHRSLLVNEVPTDKYTVHEGDCRKMVPVGCADRVFASLVPTSRQYLVTACRALRQSGGHLHIQEYVPWDADRTAQITNVNMKNLERADSGISSATEEVFTSADSPPPVENEPKAAETDAEIPEVESPTNEDHNSTPIDYNQSESIDGKSESEPTPKAVRPRRKNSRLQMILDDFASRRTPAPSVDADFAAGKWPKLPPSYRRFAIEIGGLLIKFMNNLNELEGQTYTACIERVGLIKPLKGREMDHLVVDILVRPLKNEHIDFEAVLEEH